MNGSENAERLEASRSLRPALLVGPCILIFGCAPTVNVLGAYFPSSLVSAAIGLIASYLLVRVLARVPALRALAQSALLFVSLTIIVGFVTWWGLFGGS